MTKESGSSKNRKNRVPKSEDGSVPRRDLARHAAAAVAAMAVGASMLGSKASAQSTISPSRPGVRPQQQGPSASPLGKTGRSIENRIEIRVPRDLHLSPEAQTKLKTDFQNEIVETIRKTPTTTPALQDKAKVQVQEIVEIKEVEN
jgi:hypothetical protein